jgi:hypothetical protein
MILIERSSFSAVGIPVGLESVAVAGHEGMRIVADRSRIERDIPASHGFTVCVFSSGIGGKDKAGSGPRERPPA